MQVLVIGGGTMGAGIAQVMVAAGNRVLLVETSPDAAGAAGSRVVRGLARAAASDRAGASREGPAGEGASSRNGGDGREALLTVVVGLPEAAADVELVVEAVYEDEAVKRRVLAEVEGRVGTTTLVASNTSSLSIGALAADLQRPERFLGMHFFNPVPRSALVELVVGPETGDAAVAEARRWVRALGKEEIVVRDSPGFATSRLGVAAGLEAMRMLEEGVATAEDIDRGMVLGYRHPMGPLRLTDLVGLDVRLAIAEYLARTLGERFAPPQLLRDKVAAGELGKKTGKGFFEWDAP
jgi:3-hydroxybutyryl-CoA dehydrogenase